ncbi:flagellar biosynthesis repressor FlbT [Amorphus orientalis]|uniref:Flagellar protein FlbT n=1 Tax=Amorphus orientalis TaxID=649198 RepID=A0AAE3VTK1_9HYPH|nr:flagellar biosynthesis repressor FlbT [Amorphus orientalis]MDQ0317575.1 flagellar protein FlbT [Amorphus orientalis]
MTKPIQISLRAGERIYINGAVIRVGRKVTLELLNDVTFLLESHVMQVEDTTTPLRQLYFVVQTMLIDPRNAEATRALFESMHEALVDTCTNADIQEGLAEVKRHVEAHRPFDGLRTIRRLFAVEDSILGRSRQSESHGRTRAADRLAETAVA